jgi:hypothetical protein
MLDEKPIATAPRDGSEIMVWCDDGVWRKVRWEHDDVWVTTDGEMHIHGASTPDVSMINASLWAPVVTSDDGAAQAAIASDMLSGPTSYVK